MLQKLHKLQVRCKVTLVVNGKQCLNGIVFSNLLHAQLLFSRYR